jgi:type IV pilus assembly protein PilN
MIRINLLPHREQKRKARIQRFVVLAVIAVGIGAAVTGAGYIALSAQIAIQDERNAYLTDEITKLDKQIAEIETLKKERQLLLDRKKVVERLQSNRSETVKIFDQLARQTPEGVYLHDLKQAGDQITLMGYAQSAARVSTLMRSLVDSNVFEQPNLIEIKSATVNNQVVSEFNLVVKVVREQDQAEQGKNGGKSAAKTKEAAK